MAHPLPHFSLTARILHWLMAIMIVAMLFVGVGMVSTVSAWHSTLLGIHRPLGIAILLLAVARLGVRLKNGAPPLPADIPAWQRVAAHASHVMLYALMIAMPLLGWSMLSAEGTPVVLYGSLHLPPIAPHDIQLYAVLRAGHTYLALLLFATFLMHLSAALFHALIRRDGVWESITSGKKTPR